MQSQIEIEQAYRRLANLYARAMDRNEPALLDTALATDIALAGPGFSVTGIAEVRPMPAMLRHMYRMTRHLIHNQTITLVGAGEAHGETYCTASHLLPSEDTILIWAIRYQDSLRREGDEWRLTSRHLIVDWTENRPINLTSGPEEDNR